MKGCATCSRVDAPSRHVSDIPLKWLLLKWSRNVEAVWNVARPVQTVPSLCFHLVERSRKGAVHICTVLLESHSIGVISIKKTAHVDPHGHMAWLSLVLVLCGTWAVHFHGGGGMFWDAGWKTLSCGCGCPNCSTALGATHTRRCFVSVCGSSVRTGAPVLPVILV